MNMNKYKFSLTFLILFFYFLSLGASFAAGGQDKIDLQNLEGEPELSQPLQTGGLLVRYILSVIGVLILTYLGVKLLVNRTNPLTQYDDWIQVIDYMPLGTNRGFYLVEIEGKGFVLGITEQQINILSVIEDPERLDELRGLSLKRKQPAKFSFKLGTKKNDSFHQALEMHIKQTQELYHKHKRGDKTYEE